MALERILKSKVVFAIILFCLIGFFLIQKRLVKNNNLSNTNNCRIDLEREIKGVVIKSFFDESVSHKGFVILLKNQPEYRPFFGLKKLEAANLDEGDSIYKKSGSFKFLIFKKNYENAIILDDTLDCNELK